jgi:hypothetical protein
MASVAAADVTSRSGWRQGDGVNTQTVMYEAEYEQIKRVYDRLVREANAKVVFLVKEWPADRVLR